MRQADVYVDDRLAGILTEWSDQHYDFEYLEDYQGLPVSLTMPLNQKKYVYPEFPSFFEGLLPEGFLLNALLRYAKLDSRDYFGQLLLLGSDLVGNVTVFEHK